jgi:hypothetical protein
VARSPHGSKSQRAAFVRVNIHDPKSFDLQTQLGLNATPEFYLIDPQGRIERKWDDSIDLAQIPEGLRWGMTALVDVAK